MNADLIPIYVGIALVLVLQVVILVLQIKQVKRSKKAAQEPMIYAASSVQQASTAGGIVHCRSCGERMDSAQRYCPKCGASRS